MRRLGVESVSIPAIIASHSSIGSAKFARASANSRESAQFGARSLPRQSAELSRNDNYWDASRRAKLDRIVLLPMPEANTRLAALRSGQVDWIEVPPPDAIGSLRQAGFNIVTNSYPHVWPWVFATGRASSPVADVRVRQALNYCIDREGMVQLLNGTAEPSVGFVKANDPTFGNPQNRYRLDPARGRALLAEAGYNAQRPLTLKVQISASGSGQMQPLPMNEFLQQDLKQIGVNVEFDVVEWNTLFANWRQGCTHASARGAHATNVSFAAMDPFFAMVRFWDSKMAPPVSNNWGFFNNPRFDAMIAEARNSFEPAARDAALARLHAAGVDEALFIWIAHDVSPRAMSPRVRGYVQPQSWFVDLRLPFIQ